MDTLDPLDQTLTLIASAPESASALTLYALACTLEHQKAGCLFKLTKLFDLPADQRRLAYGLMELLAAGEVGTQRWIAAKSTMDDLIRGTPRHSV
ncbi:hypothetical protein [Thiocapsa marina]|uniref:Uncharacterized protein n=1 Tax=Thiocapsa marina 5811 TaxID=768671 RepID=F9U7I4_9GAMM|nr:hypothetical protein [Thiocapsa marina]EGV20210.1 hypothetical protein ThimaDRAFT_0886 [Thiocapsa marina 5811]